MFGGCWKFTSNLSEWDVSNSTRFNGMFCYAHTFYSNLSRWESRDDDETTKYGIKHMFTGAHNMTDMSDLPKWARYDIVFKPLENKN